jgi:hypothetical protein
VVVGSHPAHSRGETRREEETEAERAPPHPTHPTQQRQSRREPAARDTDI